MRNKLLEEHQRAVREAKERQTKEGIERARIERERKAQVVKNSLILTLGENSLPMVNGTFELAEEMTHSGMTGFKQEEFCLVLKEDIVKEAKQADLIFEACLRGMYEATPQFAAFQRAIKMAEESIPLKDGCDSLIALRESIPDPFVFNRWDAPERQTAQRIAEIIKKPFQNGDTRALLEAVQVRVDEVRRAVPGDRTISFWADQSARDWIASVKNELLKAPTRKPPAHTLEILKDVKQAGGTAARHEDNAPYGEESTAKMYANQSPHYQGQQAKPEEHQKFPLFIEYNRNGRRKA